MFRQIGTSFLLLMVLTSSYVQAQELSDPVPVSRYSSLKTGVTMSQESLLANTISVSIEPGVETVGSAIEVVLDGSGFSIAELENSDPYLNVLYRSPLPDVHRMIGPATISDILSVLAGPAWQLITDPVNRLVSFDLKERYWPCGYTRGALAKC